MSISGQVFFQYHKNEFTHGVLPKPATCNDHTAYKEAAIAPNSDSRSYLKAKKRKTY